MKTNKYWFRPKRYGYGAYPITKEGWGITIGLIIAILLSAKLLTHGQTYLFVALLLIYIIIFIIIAKKKTEGEWKFRWGSSK